MARTRSHAVDARGPAHDRRLVEHVQRLGEEHPPIDLATVDFTVHDPAELSRRYGHVLDYMARVELEVDRNVLELITLLPDPPEVDRTFYADVWQPQEIRHGEILDELQTRIGRPPATTDRDHVSARLRVLGALGHLTAVQDVSRMLYYLTGMSTERSAVLAYNLLHDGVLELGETGRRRDGRRADPAPGARALRLLQDVRPGPRRRARRLAAVAGPPAASRHLRPGRRQQPRAARRLR